MLKGGDLWQVPEMALLSDSQPSHHNDPCDRFIIATAMQHSMEIVSCDKLIADYKDVWVVW